MTKINAKLIRKLRDDSGAPVMRVKNVLEELKGNEKEALKILKKEGFEKASKRTERETTQGKIFTYTHHTGKVAGVAELLCETDFVARNKLFEELGKNLTLQVASMKVKDVKDLEKQDFIKDPSKKVGDLVKEVIAKTGENVKVGRVWRIKLGGK